MNWQKLITTFSIKLFFNWQHFCHHWLPFPFSPPHDHHPLQTAGFPPHQVVIKVVPTNIFSINKNSDQPGQSQAVVINGDQWSVSTKERERKVINSTHKLVQLVCCHLKHRHFTKLLLMFPAQKVKSKAKLLLCLQLMRQPPLLWQPMTRVAFPWLFFTLAVQLFLLIKNW